VSWSTDVQALLDRMAERTPLPHVRRLHLPPPPAPGRERGEFCALELDDGTLGLAYVLLGDTLPRLRAAASVEGTDALALAREFDGGDTVRRTLAFAAVNALTRCLFDRAGYVPPRSADSFGALDVRPGETLGMIGYFAPLVSRLVARGAKLLVVELREDLVRDNGTVRVTTDAAELSHCRQVLATGTLMLNDSLERMLTHCRGAERVSLVGPSVGGPPDPLFARGITLLGGHWVHDAPGFVAALQAGEPTGSLACKSSIVRADYPGWDALLLRV
jgi:uncharacterized protein (DUF4213/DUF364 family)